MRREKKKERVEEMKERRQGGMRGKQEAGNVGGVKGKREEKVQSTVPGSKGQHRVLGFLGSDI